MTKAVLTFAAIGEAVAGLALVVAPALVVQVLFAQGLTGIAVPIARAMTEACPSCRDEHARYLWRRSSVTRCGARPRFSKTSPLGGKFL
jgi:hypothetical protein